MLQNKPLKESAAWGALRLHYEKIKAIHLRQLFAEDANRGQRFTAEGAGLYLDFSKNRITDETVRLLVQLARERGVEERRDAMFRGEKINVTEKRAVLHVALRAPKGASVVVDGENVVPQVYAVLDKMADFSNRSQTPVNIEQNERRRHKVQDGIGIPAFGSSGTREKPEQSPGSRGPHQRAERSRSRENPLFVTYSQIRHAGLSACKSVRGFPNPAYAIKIAMQFSILLGCRAKLWWLTTIRIHPNRWRSGLPSWRAGWPRAVHSASRYLRKERCQSMAWGASQ